MTARPKLARPSPEGHFPQHKSTHLARGPYQRRNLVIQSPYVIRNQYSFGCCEGQSVASCIEPFVPDCIPSGWHLYRAALELDGAKIDHGTTFASVHRALREFGVLKYADNECEDEARCLADLRDGFLPALREQAATSRFDLNVQSVDVHDPSAFDQICDAIDTGFTVQWAAEVNAKFEAFTPDDIADSSCFERGPGSGGHSMRFVGFDRQAGFLLGLTSWGDWDGAIVRHKITIDWPDVRLEEHYSDPGTLESIYYWLLPGAFWVRAEALPTIWETHVILGSRAI